MQDAISPEDTVYLPASVTRRAQRVRRMVVEGESQENDTGRVDLSADVGRGSQCGKRPESAVEAEGVYGRDERKGGRRAPRKGAV